MRFVLLALVLIAAVAIEAMALPQGRPTVRIDVEIEPAASGSRMGETRVLVAITNDLTTTLRLDKRSLIPPLLVTLLDSHGDEVPQLPCALPREATPDDVVLLRPGERFDLSFPLRRLFDEIVFQEVPPGDLRLFVCYPGADSPSDSTLDFTDITFCSDEIQLRVPAVGTDRPAQAVGVASAPWRGQPN